MLQVPFIRQHINLVKERLAFRGFNKIELVDEVINLDDQRKKLQFEKDELLGKVNSISKEVGMLMKTGDKAAMVGIYKLRHNDKRKLKKRMLQISNKWKPYRTYACLHLWHWLNNV